jgi:replicative DNA helicase
MGKSALALCMAANIAVRQNIPVGMFTLEMSKAEVTQRLMCSEAKVESQRLRNGKLAPDDWPRLTAACDKLAKAPIYVDDTGSINMMEIRSKARRLKSRNPDLGLLIVDYLQLMSSAGSSENRVQEVSQISRSLKILARDLEVPIVALSQLSRAVEQRTDKRPVLSDLRESGCLAGDTRVYLPDEGVYRPIRDLEGRSGFRVLAVDTESWRLEPRTVTHAFSTGRKPVFRLRTRLGREIRATANHKFLAFDGWRRLDDLAPGMRLAVPRTLVGPEAETMTDSELALLGHLIGDGCTLPRHAIQYTTKDRDLAGLVFMLADDVFGDAVAPRIKAERTWYRVYLSSARRLTHGVRNPVAAWLDELGAFGLRSWEKRVPEKVFRQGPWGIATFLRHLWATDGCINADAVTPVVRYDSSSKELVVGVNSLLLRLGINATLREVSMGSKGRPIHRLNVMGRDDQERFLSAIGGVGVRKAEEHERLLNRLAKQGRGNPKRDVIPSEAWRTLVAAAVAGPELASLATSDVYWDEILTIAPGGEDDVYDLTVEDLHNFVAEDMSVHNSIEQDADLVAFIYRDEYYNDESDQQGLAEVILAKHRNGPTDALKLSFLKRYAKFADLAAQ